MNRLYYFTDSYPFSVDYTWKSAEIEAAAKQFAEVIIVPFTFKKDNLFNFPKNVRVVAPTIKQTLYAKPKYLKHLFSKSQPQNWLLELFRAFFKGKQAIIAWYLATVYSDLIVKNAVFEELKVLEDKKKTVLFFQWTINNALLIPLLKKWGFQQIICRMHGFDLYEFRHANYLPYKAAMLKAASICTFISEHGKNYAQKIYPFIQSKSQVHYLGAKSMDKNTLDANQKFHLLSISRVVPLKRLDLIVEALRHIKTPIKWTHIGDGANLNELKEKASSIKANITTCELNFLGWLSPKEIASFFSQNGINALILVSETEGLPVVIMEAFSAGVPVIATNVGGVAELVNQKNGVLLSAQPTITEIAAAIDGLANESKDLMQQRRGEAYQLYCKSFNLEKNSETFINFLSEQCH
tara:strand:+ start:54 stop:1283 length:1230 start_codon:yes stop_codon:yes gene_type:complete